MMIERAPREGAREADHGESLAEHAMEPVSSVTEPSMVATSVSCEAEIHAVLAHQPCDHLAHAFAQKEVALRAIFARLTVAESRVLAGRLRRPRRSDAIASLFHRMIEARRKRLLHFLDRAHRREVQRARMGRVDSAAEEDVARRQQPAQPSVVR